MHDLPPPPPVEGIAAWQDREALLHDRSQALGELTRRSVGAARLIAFVLAVAGFQLGWVLLSTALTSLDGGTDAFTLVFATAVCLLALLPLLPSGLAVAVGFSEDRAVRELLRRWAVLERDPMGDARFQRTGMVLCWLLVSFGFIGTGLRLAVLSPESSGGNPEAPDLGAVAYIMGAGVILWGAGLLGLAKAFLHHRWAARLLTVVPARERGGAHR
jgi:hypothetical protein